MGKHLSYEQRLKIEEMRNANCSVQSIADQIGVSRSTIYKEFERGDKDGKYYADISYARYQSYLLKKGRVAIIPDNPKLQTFISNKILEEGKSPKQIEIELREMQDTELGTVGYETIYSAIKKGYIPGVTMETLRSNIATLQKEGNVYIPKWILEKCVLKPGQKFEVSLEKDTINLKIIKEKLS